MEGRAYDRLNSCATPSLDMQELVKARIVLLLWSSVCLALILVKLLHIANWPWIVVLAPIWLPVATFCLLLMCAMWLDKLNE